MLSFFVQHQKPCTAAGIFPPEPGEKDASACAHAGKNTENIKYYLLSSVALDQLLRPPCRDVRREGVGTGRRASMSCQLAQPRPPHATRYAAPPVVDSLHFERKVVIHGIESRGRRLALAVKVLLKNPRAVSLRHLWRGHVRLPHRHRSYRAQQHRDRQCLRGKKRVPMRHDLRYFTTSSYSLSYKRSFRNMVFTFLHTSVRTRNQPPACEEGACRNSSD